MNTAETAFESIAAVGGSRVEAPTVIRASVPLELSGEVVRNRICTFTDDEAQEWALRPDLTLPVALNEVQERRDGLTGESLRRYRGPIFRLPALAGEPVEYDQVGVERFGGPRSGATDVWVFETVAEACRATGVESGSACFGDLAIFPAFVDALDLQSDLALGLKRAFRQEGGVRAYLAGRSQSEAGISNRLTGLDRNQVGAFVEDIFAMTGVQPVGERTSDEIVERLYQRAQAAAQTEISDQAREVLDMVLSLETNARSAPDALKQIAKEAGLTTLDPILGAFAQRMDLLAETGFAGFVDDARFATRFGRRFTYYDGFVFEIAADASAESIKRPFAAGGRYDSLLSNLSAGAVDATAIGGIVIPHRLARLTGAPS